MSIKTETVTIERRYCDRCGDEITDENNGYSFITVSFNHEIAFEAWTHGDYCEDCGHALIMAVLDDFALPERYADFSKQERIEIERGILEDIFGADQCDWTVEE